MRKTILAVFVLGLLACTAPDDDSGAGNAEAQNASPVQNPAADALAGSSETQDPPLDGLAGDGAAQNPPVDALQYYLGLKKLSMNQMYVGQDGSLVNRERRQITNESGETVSLVHSIRLITSGVNKDRQAFLVQESYTQPDAMLPQHDRYMCTLLVFISSEGRWVLENNNMFNESDADGVTRRTEPCEGFELAWEDKYPVLLSTTGKVSLQDGKYVLEVLESDRPQ
jgi:hypothetical protein